MIINNQQFNATGTWFKPGMASYVDVILGGATASRQDYPVTGSPVDLLARRYKADELPAELRVTVGEPDGYAIIITHRGEPVELAGRSADARRDVVRQPAERRLTMAGSWKRMVNEDGTPRESADGEPDYGHDLENEGDYHEALEECYGMIWFLADQVATLIEQASRESMLDIIATAQGNYQDGVALGKDRT